jgi:uncharacterized protein (TIGR02246 family)
MRYRWAIPAALLAAISVSHAWAGSSATDAAGEALVASFSTAWAHADAGGLAALFAPDADLVTSDGVVAHGSVEIGQFYAGAFERGYRGSSGTAKIAQTRLLAPNIALIDATWSIAGAHNADGSARSTERGTLAAVLGFGPDGWRVLALRESTSAAAFGSLTGKP